MRRMIKIERKKSSSEQKNVSNNLFILCEGDWEFHCYEELLSVLHAKKTDGRKVKM